MKCKQADKMNYNSVEFAQTSMSLFSNFDRIKDTSVLPEWYQSLDIFQFIGKDKNLSTVDKLWAIACLK